MYQAVERTYEARLTMVRTSFEPHQPHLKEPLLTELFLQERTYATERILSIIHAFTPSTFFMDLQDLLKPTESSQDEFNSLVEELRTELTEADAASELVDAARFNEVDVVRAILTVYPQTINCADTHQNTPLHMASANGHVGIVTLLLQLGADASRRNEKGNTPLHWAASNSQQAVVDVLLTNDQVDVLQRNSFGRSALTEGFESQNTDVVQSLLEHKTATEERLMQTDVEMTDTTEIGVTHEFDFDGTLVRIRELPIAKNDQESILGQASPSDDTTGLSVWAASLVTARWMVSLSDRFAGKRVLELGAGCGVPGLALAQAVPTCQVYLTDFNPRTVENLRHNIELNCEASSHVEALEMNWQDASTWPSDLLSVVIGSDLIYQSDMVPLLLQTIQGLLEADGVFFYVAPATGRQGQDDFFRGMEEAKFKMQEHPLQSAWTGNPLASRDEDLCFLHFHELQSTEFRLFEFTRQV